MKGCIFVTANDSRYGFSLAGFQQIITDRDAILNVLTKITKENPPGLVFVDERLLDESVAGRLQLLEKQWGGAIIMLPEPGQLDEEVERDTGRRFISRVLGYQMKLS